jgi:hypothetical protein
VHFVGSVILRTITVTTLKTNDDHHNDNGIGHNAIKSMNIALCAKLIGLAAVVHDLSLFTSLKYNFALLPA